MAHEMIRNTDGNFVIVGKTYRQKEEESKGLYLVFNTAFNRFEEPRLFGKSGNNELLAVQEKHDGNMVMAGYSKSTERAKKKGWFIQLDIRKNKVIDTLYEFGEDIEFQKMIVTSDNNVFIAGKIGGKKSGFVGVYKVLEDHSLKRKLIGDNIMNDVIGISETTEGKIAVLGNIKRENTKRLSYDYCITYLNKDLEVERPCKNFTSTPDFEELEASSSNRRKEMIAVGNINQKWGTPNQVFSIKVGLPQETQLIFEKKENVNLKGRAIAKINQNNYLVIQKLENQAYSSFSANYYEGAREIDNLILTKYQREASFHLITTQSRNFALASDTIDAAKQHQIVLKKISTDFPRRKSLASARIEFIQNPVLFDGDRNKYLTKGESAYISFTIKNTGQTVFTRGTCLIKPTSDQLQITHRPDIPLDDMLPNEEQIITIPIDGHDLIKKEYAILDIVIQENGEPIASRRVKIIGLKEPILESGRPPMLDIIEYNQGDRSPQGKIKLLLRVTSEKGVSRHDKTTMLNGEGILVDLKSEEKFDTFTTDEGVTNEFVQEITLKHEGDNRIQFEVFYEGQFYRKDTVIHVDRLPALHVLAIGPHYTKEDYQKPLLFNTKDAADFGAAMQYQLQQKYQGRGRVEVLNTAQNTKGDAIRIAFENLKKRYRQEEVLDKIYPDDLIVVLISSHGEVINDEFRIIPSDFKPDNESTSSVTFSALLSELEQLYNCNIVLFLDACYSGAASFQTKRSNRQPLLDNTENRSNITIITSSTDLQPSYEGRADLANGYLTEALLEALKNEKKEVDFPYSNGLSNLSFSDQNADGQLTIPEIFEYLYKRVKYSTKVDQVMGPQFPSISNSGNDPDLKLFEVDIRQ